MASKGLVIPLSLDPREWIRGIRRVEDTLEDVGDELRDTEQVGDRLGRSLEDAFRDAGRAAENLDDGIRQAGGNARIAGGVLAGEVFDEFIQSWSEAVSSGDYGEAIRDTFANLGQIGGAAFGPAGAAVGGALGLVLVQAYDSWMDTEGKEKLKAATAAAFEAAGGDTDTAYERGKNLAIAETQGYVDQKDREAKLIEALGVETIDQAYLEIQRQAELTGLDVRQVEDAYLGVKGALEDVRGAQETLNEKIRTGEFTNRERVGKEINQQLLDLEEGVRLIDQQTEAFWRQRAAAVEARRAQQVETQLNTGEFNPVWGPPRTGGVIP